MQERTYNCIYFTSKKGGDFMQEFICGPIPRTIIAILGSIALIVMTIDIFSSSGNNNI